MNITATPAMAEQEHPPSQAQQVDALLKYQVGVATVLGEGELELVKGHIALLRRQAAKAKNQRKTLKQLHRAHRAIIMESRWLRESISHFVGAPIRERMGEFAKGTLWKQFREELSKDD